MGSSTLHNEGLVVDSSDFEFELSDDNKLVETNGTHKTNMKPSHKEGSLEEAEAVQAATDKRRDREVGKNSHILPTGHWYAPSQP